MKLLALLLLPTLAAAQSTVGMSKEELTTFYHQYRNLDGWKEQPGQVTILWPSKHRIITSYFLDGKVVKTRVGAAPGELASLQQLYSSKYNEAGDNLWVDRKRHLFITVQVVNEVAVTTYTPAK